MNHKEEAIKRMDEFYKDEKLWLLDEFYYPQAKQCALLAIKREIYVAEMIKRVRFLRI